MYGVTVYLIIRTIRALEEIRDGIKDLKKGA